MRAQDGQSIEMFKGRPTETNSSAAVALTALLLVGCGEAAEPADRDALIGVWKPEDGTTRTVEFKPDGVFDYKYFATLRLNWSLTRKGRIELSSVEGVGVLKCYFTIEGNQLRIDDGNGNTCVTPAATPPNPMPLTFRKVK